MRVRSSLRMQRSVQIGDAPDIDRSEESPYDYRLHGVLAGGWWPILHRGEPGVRGRRHDGVAAWRRSARSRWTRGSGRVWRVTCVAIRVAVACPSPRGRCAAGQLPEAAHRSLSRWPHSSTISVFTISIVTRRS